VPAIASQIPPTLRPFAFHGLRLDYSDGVKAKCDCPSCGREGGKFDISLESGEYKCFSCDFHGGSTTFMRWLWEQSDKRTNGESVEFAADRGLLNWETLTMWGCAVSILSGAWLIPGYNPEGSLTQLYKRIKFPDRWELRPTPDVGGHAMHGLPLLNRDCDTIYLAEGPWDAMALWEALRMAKPGDGGLEHTGNPGASLLGNASVLAVPNCGAVGEPMRRFLPLFQGKRVVLCFDNDHPRQNGDQVVDGAGWSATKRAAMMLAGVAREVWFVRWTEGGADLTRPDGWDVRDALTT
jgi:hypothetical protein